MANDSDENTGEVIDGETGVVVDTLKPGRPIKLSDLRDVRLELAAVYRGMRAGSIKTQDGTRMAYVLKTIADVIVSAELEQRLADLEEQQLNGMRAQTALARQH